VRTLAVLLLLLLLLAVSSSYLRRKQNKGWLSAVASAIARRDVSVRCPGFSAKLVESTLYTLPAS